MKNFLTIIFFLTLTKADAQVPPWQWARGATGTNAGSNQGIKVKVGVSGDVYVLGTFLDDSVTFGNVTIYKRALFNGGSLNFFLLKYDPWGNLLLAKNLCSGTFRGFGFDIDANDNLYVSGYFFRDSAIVGGTTLFNPNWGSSYEQHIFLAKFDSDGNSIWAKANSNIGVSTTSSLSVDKLGNIFVFGDCSSADSIKFDSTVIAVNDSASYVFIAKFDQFGNSIWIKSASGDKQGIIRAGSVYATDITNDSFGNIVITGSFSTPYMVFDTITIYNYHPPGWWTDIFIAKYDSSGNILWAKSEGGYNQNGDSPRCISTDDSGKIYLAGHFSPNSTFDTILFQGYGEFLSQYDADGNLNWITSIGDGSSLDGLSVDGSGNILITGAFSVDSILIGTTILYNNPYPYASFPKCLFLAKYDDQGNALWAEKVIGYGFGSSVCTNTFGDIYLAGGCGRDSIIFGSDILFSNNYSTTFTAKLSFTTDIIEANEEDNLPIPYPNPFSSQLTISLADNEQTTVSLYNFLGQQILQQTFTNSTTINTEQFANGIYFYELRNDKGRVANGKVIRQ